MTGSAKFCSACFITHEPDQHSSLSYLESRYGSYLNDALRDAAAEKERADFIQGLAAVRTRIRTIRIMRERGLGPPLLEDEEALNQLLNSVVSALPEIDRYKNLAGLNPGKDE